MKKIKILIVTVISLIIAAVLFSALVKIIESISKNDGDAPTEPTDSTVLISEPDVTVPDVTTEPYDTGAALKETEEIIKKLYFEMYCSDYTDFTYDEIDVTFYGAFSNEDIWVVQIKLPLLYYVTDDPNFSSPDTIFIPTDQLNVKVGEWAFKYSYGILKVYDGERFYGIDEAYENGILTDDQLDAVGAEYPWSICLSGISFDELIKKEYAIFYNRNNSKDDEDITYTDIEIESYLSDEENELWCGTLKTNIESDHNREYRESAGNWQFCYNKSKNFHFYAYSKGRFYVLGEAYYLKFINDTHLEEIAQNCDFAFEYINDEEFVKARTEEIQKAYFEIFHKSETRFGYEDIKLRFYGQYKDAAVMFVDVPNVQYSETPTRETVGGYLFEYSTAQRLVVYCDGKFMNLNSAYEKGILNDRRLLGLSYNYDKITHLG